jgi:hypothetical protein
MSFLCAGDELSWWVAGDKDICNGGSGEIAMNYASKYGALPYMNNKYFLGWSGKKTGMMQGLSRDPSVCKYPTAEKVKLTMSGDEKSEETGRYKYKPLGDITDIFFKKNKWYETSTEAWINVIKALLYEYGPLPLSMQLRESFIYHGRDSQGKIYASKPVNALGEKMACWQKLQPRYPPWFCNTRKQYTTCQDRTYKCRNKIGGHAMKLVGWGVKQDVEYWWVENSYGKSWGDEGYFKLQMRGNGYMYKEMRVAVDSIGARRLGAEIGPEPTEARNERLLVQEGTEDFPENSDGAPIVIPNDREDVLEIVAVAMTCGNNVSEGIASTLIAGQNFSTATTNYMNFSIAETRDLECLKDALKVSGIEETTIVHTESQVVEGFSYNIVLDLTISAGAKIGDQPIIYAPATGKASILLQIYGYRTVNNTYGFSSRVYPGQISDFDAKTTDLPENTMASHGILTKVYNKFILFAGLLLLTFALF